MPSRLPLITAATTAERIQLRPETIDLADARDIYRRLAGEAMNISLRSFAGELRSVAEYIQEITETPAPDGLVTSARMLHDADALVVMAEDLRIDVAGGYDRFHPNTAAATEALEIITAWAVLQETADENLRCGLIPAG